MRRSVVICVCNESFPSYICDYLLAVFVVLNNPFAGGVVGFSFYFDCPLSLLW